MAAFLPEILFEHLITQEKGEWHLQSVNKVIVEFYLSITESLLLSKYETTRKYIPEMCQLVKLLYEEYVKDAETLNRVEMFLDQMIKVFFLRLRLTVPVRQLNTLDKINEKMGKSVGPDEYSEMVIGKEEAEVTKLMAFVHDFLMPWATEAYKQEKLRKQNILFFGRTFTKMASLLEMGLLKKQQGKMFCFNSYLVEQTGFFELKGVSEIEAARDDLITEIIQLEQLVTEDENLSKDGEIISIFRNFYTERSFRDTKKNFFYKLDIVSEAISTLPLRHHLYCHITDTSMYKKSKHLFSNIMKSRVDFEGDLFMEESDLEKCLDYFKLSCTLRNGFKNQQRVNLKQYLLVHRNCFTVPLEDVFLKT